MINIKKVLLSTMTMIYFIMLVLHNIYQTQILEYIWYFVLIACFILGFIRSKIVITNYEITLFVMLFSTGIINIVLIGNNTISGLIFSVLYLGVYRLLADKDVETNYLLVSIYIDCLICAINIIQRGFGKPIMGSLSNNFISALILLPTIVYYIKLENEGKRIPLVPAIAVVITCALAVGRSGIIVSALLLLFLIYYVSFIDKHNAKTYNKFFLRFLVVIICILLVFVFMSYSSSLQSLQIFQRFSKYGMYGTGRTGMWEEYLETMNKSIKDIIFGVDYTRLSLMIRYKNNLHNSFFNLHADYGIIFLIYIIYKMIAICKECIKQKKWIYLFMTIIFIARACVDKIFGGGSSATVVLFFLILYGPEKAFKKQDDYYLEELEFG